MKLSRPKTEKYHNNEYGDVGPGMHKENYFTKKKWKRFDRKKFFKRLFKILDKTW